MRYPLNAASDHPLELTGDYCSAMDVLDQVHYEAALCEGLQTERTIGLHCRAYVVVDLSTSMAQSIAYHFLYRAEGTRKEHWCPWC